MTTTAPTGLPAATERATGMPPISIASEASADWIAFLNTRKDYTAQIALARVESLTFTRPRHDVTIVGADRDDTGIPQVWVRVWDPTTEQPVGPSLPISADDIASITYY